MKFSEQLKAMDACREAVKWVGDRTLEQAWRECKRSDWMLWLLHELGIDARECAGRFALRVWHLVSEESKLACAWAIDCALRGADKEESDAAAGAAFAAALAAFAVYADATAAAAFAADAAADPGADSAAAAAFAAARALGGHHAADRRAQRDIIRELIPLAKVRRALAGRGKGFVTAVAG